MFVNKAKLLICVSCFLLKSQGLEKFDSKENDIILVTESILRNTTNNLFSKLRFSKQGNAKIKQALLVHTFFTSITLKDHNTLNLIVQLCRTNKNKVNNETEHYTDIINEVLNEDWSSSNADSLANIEGIVQYVDEFLDNLNGLKENSSYNNDYEKLDIKNEIIHILKSDNPSEFNPLKLNQSNTPLSEDEDSDNEFWVPQLTRRIYRGDRTKIKHFPFMASIQIFKTFQCAGSIIKSDLIVTAASCLQLAWNNRFFRENPAFLSARVGSNFYNGGGEDIPVLEVYFHPSYNPKNLRNNIAVARLVRHLKFRKHRKRLKKIDIDKQDSPLPMTTDGITVVGWGARGHSNILQDPWSNQLAFAVLDVYHLQECQEIYSREYVTRTNFCAGFVSKGGGACNHDVGGPGVVNGILAGIISFGSPVCGTPDAPTVFIKVGYYADWIEEIMDQNVPSIKVRTTLASPAPLYTLPAEYLAPNTYTILPLQKLIPVTIEENNTELTETEKVSEMPEEEKLFKLFLKTIFSSSEATEFNELLNDYPVNKSEMTREKLKKGTEKEDDNMNRGKHDKSMEHEKVGQQDDNQLNELETNIGYTSMPIYDPYEERMEKEMRFTVPNTDTIDSNVENDEALHNHIVKLINNFDLSDVNEKSSSANEEDWRKEENKNLGRQKVDITKIDMDRATEASVKIIREGNSFKPSKEKKSDIFTLLYVSDNETNESLQNVVNDLEDFDDNISEGLPIEVEGFRDLAFRNNRSKSVLDFMSRSELYDLLSEAINEVTNYKQSRRRLLVFYFPKIQFPK